MNIKATIVPFQQGTPEWVQHRARSLNASDLAAAMGLSPYLTRAELIERIATGIVPEVDAATQRRFDKGHEVEAMARPLAEEVIGEELYASVFVADVDGLHLSASLDGHTLLNDATWEHKQANAALIACLNSGVVPEQYHPQMEQGQMLNGATRTLFTASNGTRESAVHVWYESRPELRAKIIPTWKQLMADVAAYVPTATEVKPVGRTPEQLPALRSSVRGELVLESNIKEWESAALVYIKSVRDHELKTDQDFEDATAAVQWCISSKTTLDGLKSNLMSATGDVNTAVGTLDRLMSELDKTRIQFTKAIDGRKAERKAEIVAGGVAAFAQHIRDLNAAMPANYMPVVPSDFGGCIKNLRTFASIQNAVDSELARVKIAAGEIATRIQTNIGKLDAANTPGLFADISTLVLKQPDDLAAIIAQRLDADQKRKDAERERAHAAQVEAQRIQDEQAELSAMSPILQSIARETVPLTAAEIEEAESDRGYPKTDATLRGSYQRVWTAPEKQPDNGARLTLGQINERLSPISVSVAGLSSLGFDPVEQVKASRLYRESEFGSICAAISAHVMSAAEQIAEAV